MGFLVVIWFIKGSFIIFWLVLEILFILLCFKILIVFGLVGFFFMYFSFLSLFRWECIVEVDFNFIVVYIFFIVGG